MTETSGKLGMSQGKTLALRCFTELWGQGRYDTGAELLHPGYRGHAPGDRDLRGAQALYDYIAEYRKGFPRLRLSVLGQIEQGDRVVTEFSLAGVHTGRWHGVPPTGRATDLGGLAFTRISGGLIVEQWYEWERRKLLEDLGLLPSLQAATA
ncbi:ester cyclase [Actinocorallia lasiicapitis]